MAKWLKSPQTLLFEIRGHVAYITLNQPEKRNALSNAAMHELHDAMMEADDHKQVRCVVLSGAGKDFCAGADLGELLESADRSLAENEAAARRLGELFIAIRRIPKPVVAVVQGRALAGGAGLATACDLVVAGTGAQFGYPEIQRGFVPAMVMTILRRLAGERLALDLVLTGRTLGAEEARGVGLVSRVVPDADLDRESGALLQVLAAASATALGFTKRLFHELDGASFEDGVALGARVNALVRQTPDFRQAIARFLER
ncbi:MAG TPA: enoyl-CoA hydratase-related protein [Gemmatimonadales bacterium]|nr:enoyl-CoA hydratase-related protein [Gemmatimonadales bacterium]